jgi:hypothetical protein
MKHHMSVFQRQAWILDWSRQMVLAHTPLQCLEDILSLSVASVACYKFMLRGLERRCIRDIITSDLSSLWLRRMFLQHCMTVLAWKICQHNTCPRRLADLYPPTCRSIHRYRIHTQYIWCGGKWIKRDYRQAYSLQEHADKL